MRRPPSPLSLGRRSIQQVRRLRPRDAEASEAEAERQREFALGMGPQRK
jgi:hypothetical protein